MLFCGRGVATERTLTPSENFDSFMCSTVRCNVHIFDDMDVFGREQKYRYPRGVSPVLITDDIDICFWAQKIPQPTNVSCDIRCRRCGCVPLTI